MRPTAGGDPALHLLRSPTPRPGPRELDEPANRALPRIHNRITEATRLLLASPAREHGVEQRRLNPKRRHPLNQRQCRRARHTNLCHFAPHRHVMTHRGNRCNRTSVLIVALDATHTITPQARRRVRAQSTLHTAATEAPTPLW